MPRYTKKLVQQQVFNAGIPFNQRQDATRQILDSLRYLRLNEKVAPNLYCPKRRVVMGKRQLHTRKGHPSFIQQRTYLISTLFQVWLKVFGKRPRINRRGSLDTPFVIFVEPILASVGVFNVLDNLNMYRSYYNQLVSEVTRQCSIETQNI